LANGAKTVSTLWPTLIEFLLRLSFGLAAAMLITPARWVTGGFFRVHLWVLMGLGTFASLAIYSRWGVYQEPKLTFGLAVAAAVVSYIGAIVWMYDAQRSGKVLLAGVTALFLAAGLTGQWQTTPESSTTTLADPLDFISGALVLGSFMAAMLLGHWYLNHPGMKLEPLRRLVGICGLALLLRGALGAAAVVYLARVGNLPDSTIGWSFLAFRWLAGLVGPAVMAVLTWETLKIPNTQSATGILYAAITLTFLGELTAQLLSRGLPVPV
jgi:hypothetical protein